jgi:hyperosmotically inducible protein
MHFFYLSNLLTFALLVPSLSGAIYAQSTDTKPKPDNTAVNKRDRNPDEATADRQKDECPDRALTAKSRKAVMADKNLSTYTHNIKIISQDGTVTLERPRAG